MSTPEPQVSGRAPEGDRPYRGRLAPSPTGYLHAGHGRTFWAAQERARLHGGVLVLRNEDLDRSRCRPEFVEAMFADLRWFGLRWQEGPDRGGPFGPYNQSERLARYRDGLARLWAGGHLFPCTCSRKEVLGALSAPHAGDDEPVYPGACRERHQGLLRRLGERVAEDPDPSRFAGEVPPFHWRFRVPDGEAIRFVDGRYGVQEVVAGRDFGDFIVWRQDGVPAYQLAVTVDDAAMGVTEVVRGADLLRSTARQLLLYRALGWTPPAFHHCPLVTDGSGVRLAKRHDALSLRGLRASGRTPESIREELQAREEAIR